MQTRFSQIKARMVAGGILILITVALSLVVGPALAQVTKIPAISKLREGNDFATLVLRDAWDMSEFTDISQYLNQSGQANLLQNISVQNGIFSASSTSNSDAQFFVLWPGYDTAMMPGKVGHNYPIDASKFHCLYLGMKVVSGAAATSPDQFQIMWFANERLNGTGETWGYSKGIALYPEAGAGAPLHAWKLYKVDLADSETHWGGMPWIGATAWQGLRVDPSIQPNINFAVDWVRLTDCSPVNYQVNWGSGESASIWVLPEGTDREILVASGVQSPYSLDTQGFPPGVYTYLVKQNGQVVDSSSFEINQTPVVKFARPSFTSGTDYATQAGNSWDFSDATDASELHDMAYSFQDGVLDMVTQSGAGIDAIIELNTPQPIPLSNVYRYLSFRLYTEGPWQNVPQAMIARWVWRIPGNSGRPGFECHLVSQDIPFDVGWNTYTIDLSDPFNGLAEETAGECAGLPNHWTETSPVVRMRFDPNENIMGTPLYQKLDWIKLTQVDEVTKGTPFPIQIILNKPPSEIQEPTFYYTDNLAQPTQHPADQYGNPPPATATPPSEEHFSVFLPLVFHWYVPPPPNGLNFLWDTSTVTPGEYYICVTVEDQYNGGTYCSEAPVQVAGP